jgi:hypothetical protein
MQPVGTALKSEPTHHDRVARDIHPNERLKAQLSMDFFNLFNRVIVFDGFFMPSC